MVVIFHSDSKLIGFLRFSLPLFCPSLLTTSTILIFFSSLPHYPPVPPPSALCTLSPLHCRQIRTQKKLPPPSCLLPCPIRGAIIACVSTPNLFQCIIKQINVVKKWSWSPSLFPWKGPLWSEFRETVLCFLLWVLLPVILLMIEKKCSSPSYQLVNFASFLLPLRPFLRQ